jgi:hypothetical protein
MHGVLREWFYYIDACRDLQMARDAAVEPCANLVMSKYRIEARRI